MDQIEEEDSSYETITSDSDNDSAVESGKDGDCEDEKSVIEEPPLVYEIITTDTNA
jgi:hypothetical protein